MITLRVSFWTIVLISQATAQLRLRGTLVTSDNPADFTMELRPAGATAMEKSTAMPGMHGQFEFGSVKPGHYILPVNNRKGDSRKEEHLFVNSGSDDVTIRLGESKAPEGRGTVNVNLLNHPVPKAAQKAIARFRKCRERQDEACAARYLDEAIAAGPDFSKPM